MTREYWYNQILPYGCVANAKNLNKKKLNDFKNRQEEQNIFMKFFMLAWDTFKYNNFPDTANPRFCELQSMMSGLSCMSYSDSQGFETLGFLPSRWNNYGDYTQGTTYGYLGNTQQVTCYLPGAINDNANCVVQRDNIACYPIINYIIDYSERLANLMRSMDLCCELLQLPYLVTCEQSQLASIEAIFKKSGEHNPYVAISDALNPDAIKAINLNSNPEVLRALWDQFKNIASELETFLGIQNQANTDKKERLVVAEATSNTHMTNCVVNTRLRSKQIWTSQINDFWGLNTSIELNEDRDITFLDFLKDAYHVNNEKEDKNNEIQ